MGLLKRETFDPVRTRATCGSILAAAAMLVMTACGNTVAGNATSSSSAAASGTSAPEAGQLDPGNYPTKPRPPLGVANTPFDGKLLDAQRMAGFVTGPWEVDPGLITDYPVGPMVLKSAKAIWAVADQPMKEAAERNGFVNGFRTSRKVEGKTILTNSVLRFPDSAAAASAAADLNQAKIDMPVNGATRGVVSIPGHPDALASNYPFTPQETKVEWKANMTSLTPHGPFVLMQQVQSTDSLDAGVALTAKTLDLQIPLIDQFTPTPVAEFPTLPKDPSGQLARTLPIAVKDATVTRPATYDRRGALHFQLDPVATSKTLDENGVDVVTNGLTTVYRTTDAASAAKVVDDFDAQVSPLATGPSAPVAGIPGGRCLSGPSLGGAYCVAAADRYVFEVQTAQVPAAKQMLAAQYLMLTAK